MINAPFRKFGDALERAFPDKRVFIRSDNDTRFVRLNPLTQLVGWTGTILVLGWAIIATAFILMDSIGSGNVRDQAKREQLLYEQRLNQLSGERDLRADEAFNAQSRFNVALDQISRMQAMLLESEDRRKEMEKGIEVIQTTLRRTIKERDDLGAKTVQLTAELNGETGTTGPNDDNADTGAAVDFLTAALTETAAQRDALAAKTRELQAGTAELVLEQKLLEEKNDRIFSQLEDAVSLSLTPLDKMFRAAGLPTEKILDTVRRGYSGQGGPLTPLTFSTRGAAPDPESLRANGILEKMDRMNLYRIAAEKAPFAVPLKSSFRYTSGFGQRWGRAHEGTDFAASYGTPIYATADGVVTFAGWSSGYGRLVKIKHAFGIETRYAHQSQIRVTVGQKVSRGDRIGDMGNSGRSTGTHLHYEVRVNGNPINPMIYIKAANDVF